jgi:hypothetical protein
MMHSFSKHSRARVSAMAFHENELGERVYRFYPAIAVGYGCEARRIAPRYNSVEAPFGDPDPGHAVSCSAAMVGLPRLF